jgi:hypothetical protein
MARSEPAVDQLRVASAGPGTKVRALHQSQPQRDTGDPAAQRQIPNDARTVDSSTDDQNIKRLIPEPV